MILSIFHFPVFCFLAFVPDRIDRFNTDGSFRRDQSCNNSRYHKNCKGRKGHGQVYMRIAEEHFISGLQ